MPVKVIKLLSYFSVKIRLIREHFTLVVRTIVYLFDGRDDFNGRLITKI